MTVENIDRRGLLGAISKNARQAVIVGVVMVFCGVVAIGAPFAAGLSVTIFAGAMLLVGGVAQSLLAFQADALGDALMMLLVGLLTAACGFFLLNQPVAGLGAITLFLAAFFLASGLAELVAAFQIRPADGWGWMLFNGVVTLLLGLMLWRQFPLSGTWAVGVLLGFKLVMGGWVLIVIGRSVRTIASDAADAQATHGSD